MYIIIDNNNNNEIEISKMWYIGTSSIPAVVGAFEEVRKRTIVWDNDTLSPSRCYSAG